MFMRSKIAIFHENRNDWCMFWAMFTFLFTNSGGLYGKITIDALGKVHPETRNAALANTWIRGLEK